MAPLQITVDSLVIGRLLGGLCWGIGFAVFLQFAKLGKFLTSERTWLAVVIGIGVDLVIAIGADWATVTGVIVASAVGIITRSLVNESRHEPDFNAYKAKWGLEEAIDLLGAAIGLLDDALQLEALGAIHAHVSKAVGAAHAAQHKLDVVRYGDLKERKR